MRHHTKEERHEVLHELECGMTINEAIQKYEISRYMILRWRIEAGGPLPRQSFTLKEKAEILIAMEEEGLSTERTAICYDNAAIESLNGIIKTEALYCRFGKTRVKDRRIPVAQLKSAVIEFIDYYNNRRPKRKLGFLSPGEFRKQNPEGTYLMVLTEEQNG